MKKYALVALFVAMFTLFVGIASAEETEHFELLLKGDKLVMMALEDTNNPMTLLMTAADSNSWDEFFVGEASVEYYFPNLTGQTVMELVSVTCEDQVIAYASSSQELGTVYALVNIEIVGEKISSVFFPVFTDGMNYWIIAEEVVIQYA